MNDVTFVIDERKTVRTNFFRGDDVAAALGRAEQGETEGGEEKCEQQTVLVFDAMQAGFELGKGVRVHEPK